MKDGFKELGSKNKTEKRRIAIKDIGFKNIKESLPKYTVVRRKVTNTEVDKLL